MPADIGKPFGMENRQLIALALLVLLGSAGGGAVQDVINPPRPDPFTGSAGTHLEQRLMDRLQQLEARLRLEIIQMELEIRQDMPPEPVRERLRAVERVLERMDPEFSPPTTDWRSSAE